MKLKNALGRENTAAQSTRREFPHWLEVLRVSTDGQDVQRQEVDLRDMRDQHRATAVEHLELVDVSGTETHLHPSVQRIIQRLADPDNDGVAAEAIDRLLRPRDFASMAMFNAFLDHGKCIWTKANGKIDPSTPEGWSTCMTALHQAGMTWRNICTRVRDGMRLKRDRKELPYFIPPYGYVRRRHRAKVGGRPRVFYTLELDTPEKQEVVRHIYRLSAEVKSDYAIAAILNAEGIPAPLGGIWRRTTISRVLGQRAYIGTFVWAGERMGLVTEYECPRILAEAEEHLWTIAQGRARRNQHRLGGRLSETHQLQHLLWCKECQQRDGVERRMNGRKVRDSYRKYQCYDPACKSPSIRGEYLEDSVWDAALDTYTQPEQLAGMLAEANQLQAEGAAAHGPTHEDKLAKVLARRRQIEKNLDNPDQDYRYDELTAQLRDAKAEIAKLELAVHDAKLVQMPTRVTLEALAEAFKMARTWTTYEQRRHILLLMVERIDYFDGEYSMTLRVPVAAADVGLISQRRNQPGRESVLARLLDG